MTEVAGQRKTEKNQERNNEHLRKGRLRKAGFPEEGEDDNTEEGIAMVTKANCKDETTASARGMMEEGLRNRGKGGRCEPSNECKKR